MADEIMTETDDEELIPVETPPEDKPAEAETADSTDEDDDQPEDARLGDSEEGEEPSATSKRRKQRREYARLKRDEARAELEMLRNQNAELIRRVGAVEHHTLASNEAAIYQRLQQAQADVAQAEEIFAKATSEGQGDYALQAIRIRDAAKAEADRLTALQQQTAQQRQRAEEEAKTAPVRERINRHKGDWMRDNPWFDANATDEVSALTKQIDAQIAQAGYKPEERLYWEELTRRVSHALNSRPGASSEASAPSRTAPPMGTSREHAPPSTRRSEIYVTPARKAAMIEAGIWDDPVRRQRMLKEYREYDKAPAR